MSIKNPGIFWQALCDQALCNLPIKDSLLAVLSNSEPDAEGQDRENVEPDDEMANEQQIGGAPFMADAIALARLEKQKTV